MVVAEVVGGCLMERKARDPACAFTRRITALLLCLLLSATASFGYMMRSQFSLEELTATADFVFKGTVNSSVTNGGPSSADFKTQFNVISVIKGSYPGPSVTFLHRDQAADSGTTISAGPDPVHYHFDAGKTYLVFAKNTGVPGVYQSLWDMPQSEGNQGVFLCADDKPVSANITEVVWRELTGLLQHHDTAEILYAIQQLDQMSGGGWGEEDPKKFNGRRKFDTTLDFNRRSVIDAVHSFVASPDAKVAGAAIKTIGSNNPYMTQERALFWLATVGSGEISGLSKMDPRMENLGGEVYWNDLVSVANGSAPEATRALAIRALGLARKPEIGAQVTKWITDSSAPIRAAATVVLADYPALSPAPQLDRASTDPDTSVRIAAAQCIGFGQIQGSVETLSVLLTDPDLEVRKAAAMSLLSFSARDPEVAAILKANLGTHEFAENFVISLARIDPEKYRDDLARSVATWSPTKPPPPAGGLDGRVPAGDAQEILLKYLKAQSAVRLQSVEFKTCLDAMDKAALDQLSSPLDVYALYMRHGLTMRAAALRQAALKAFPYQQPISYDQAAEHPEIYGQ